MLQKPSAIKAVGVLLLVWVALSSNASLQAGFLDFENLPDTNFSCAGKVIGGYYADVETGCQMFHVCTLGQKDEVQDIKFLCLNGTVFDQETRVCERVDEVDCSKAEDFFDLNLELYAPQPAPREEEWEERQSTTTEVPSTTTTTTTPRPPAPSYFRTFVSFSPRPDAHAHHNLIQAIQRYPPSASYPHINQIQGRSKPPDHPATTKKPPPTQPPTTTTRPTLPPPVNDTSYYDYDYYDYGPEYADPEADARAEHQAHFNHADVPRVTAEQLRSSQATARVYLPRVKRETERESLSQPISNKRYRVRYRPTNKQQSEEIIVELTPDESPIVPLRVANQRHGKLERLQLQERQPNVFPTNSSESVGPVPGKRRRLKKKRPRTSTTDINASHATTLSSLSLFAQEPDNLSDQQPVPLLFQPISSTTPTSITTSSTTVRFPVTSFRCHGRIPGGLYADVEAECRVFHICMLGRHGRLVDHPFYCGSGTRLDQRSRTCKYEDLVDCSKSPRYYQVNAYAIAEDADYDPQFESTRVRGKRRKRETENDAIFGLQLVSKLLSTSKSLLLSVEPITSTRHKRSSSEHLSKEMEELFTFFRLHPESLNTLDVDKLSVVFIDSLLRRVRGNAKNETNEEVVGETTDIVDVEETRQLSFRSSTPAAVYDYYDYYYDDSQYRTYDDADETISTVPVTTTTEAATTTTQMTTITEEATFPPTTTRVPETTTTTATTTTSPHPPITARSRLRVTTSQESVVPSTTVRSRPFPFTLSPPPATTTIKHELTKPFRCQGRQMLNFFSDSRTNCRMFHFCSPGFHSNQLLHFVFACANGHRFSDKTQTCNMIDSKTRCDD